MPCKVEVCHSSGRTQHSLTSCGPSASVVDSNFHPAALRLHMAEEHPWDNEIVPLLIPLLWPHMVFHNANDHECSMCKLIFQLPSKHGAGSSCPDRALLVQMHFKAQCPVFGQILWLLSRHAGDGSLWGDGAPLQGEALNWQKAIPAEGPRWQARRRWINPMCPRSSSSSPRWSRVKSRTSTC